MKQIILIALLIILMTAGFSEAKDPCIDCHKEKNPILHEIWNSSAHAQRGISCADCHGADIEANHKRTVRVSAVKCGACHKKPYDEHIEGRHSLGLQTGSGCTRNEPAGEEKGKTCSQCHEPGSTQPHSLSQCALFLSQAPEMQRAGCVSCHRVETGCDACHSKHGTPKTAGRAETCGVCHMGPDHPQIEMWEASQHGALFKTSAIKGVAPTCTTCHMDKGTHNVSKGIALGKPVEKSKAERKFMTDICARCHSRTFAERSLLDADNIERQSMGILNEAEAIIADLNKRGLIFPAPATREPHPLDGPKIVLGAQMLYENTSGIEAVYFRMKKFHYSSAFKGAYHQSPDYAHWYGNAMLKLGLSEIKSEAAMLIELDTLRRRMDLRSDEKKGSKDSGVAGELKELEDLRLRGSISAEEYKTKKKAVLDKYGL